MNKELLKYIAIGVVGVGVGFSVGYTVSTKRAEAKYRKLADEEIESVKKAYKLMRKEDEFETVEMAAEALGVDLSLTDPGDFIQTPEEALQALADYQGVEDMDVVSRYPDYLITEPENDQTRVITLNTEIDPETGETRNVFDHGVDIDGEDLEKRGSEDAYIITLEEYMEDEQSFDKLSLVYFEEDDVLVDERNQPIPDVDKLIGEGSLNKFGHGSDSMNSLYIRNERISSDFEIVKEERSYAEAVFGVAAREPKQRPKKMRADE